MFWPLQPPQARRQGLAADFRRWIGRAGARAAARSRETAWRRDPLSHPALQAMTQRELGDLPFNPSAVEAE